MSTRVLRFEIAAITLLAAFGSFNLAMAQRPSEPPGQAKRGGPQGGPPPGAGGPTVTITISPRDQTIIRQYFGQQFSRGHCPPGLAKKNNGCLPPGQAKKWAQGQPLPSGLPYYALPSDLLARLAVPPVGYAYVRVAEDVLLMATGTRMVIDAVRDIGRM